MINLILTFDYELFGDGTGDVFGDLIEPMEKILVLCDRYQIKTTIFFEIVEYLKLKGEWDKGNKMDYTENPVAAIENQIRKAALAGHDIQLHLHPQWANAKYDNDRWGLDFDNWRLGDFHGYEGYAVTDLLRDGKAVLEDLIRHVLPEYKCIALRAGGYNVMPSAEVYEAMKELGLKIDSSIYPGGYENGKLSRYDYRDVSSELDYWWADEADMRKVSVDKQEIVEVPVFALSIPRWKKVLTFSRVKSLLKESNGKVSSVTREKIASKSFFEKIKFVLSKECNTWDVCMFPKSLHKKFFKHIIKHLSGRSNFVLIGHPKSLRDPKLFENFISTAQNHKSFQFKTLAQFYASII
jgi:hypothetical protein